MALFAIFLVGLIACTTSAPVSSPSHGRCASKCSLSERDELQYQVGMKYTYEHSGRAVLTPASDGSLEQTLPWKALVDLTWLSECDVEIRIRQPEVLGDKGPATKESLSEHPLVVGMQNGLISDVCAHPEDEPASLNLKKGIASSLQNVLPKISTSEKLSVQEETVMGRCLTVYNAQKQGSSIKITKEIQQWNCTSSALSPIAVLLSAHDDSKTECNQKIENRIITSVECSSKQNIKLPRLSMKTKIQSSLVYKTKDRSSSRMMEFKPRRTTIGFEIVPQSKSQKFEKMVISELEKACAVMGKDSQELPRRMAEVVELLYRVPEDFGVKLMDMARQSKFCGRNMEDLVWTAILSVYSPASLRAVVHELRNKKMSSISATLYGLSLQFSGESSVAMLREILSVVEDENMPHSLVLASGTIVNRFCKANQRCLEEQAVQKILMKLSQQLDSSCKSSKENSEAATKSMRVLKTLGNVGILPRDVRESVIACMSSKQAAVSVRVAGGQTLRKADMSRHEIDSLVRVLLDEQEDSEVRVAAYLAVIQRVSFLEASIILRSITKDSNSEVKSFVLSHFQNAQHTCSPYLQSLRYKIAPLLVPEESFRTYKHSKNIDLSKCFPSLLSSVAMDTNILFTKSSPIPKQIQSNITVDAFGQVINIGEIGVRLEDIDSLMSHILESGEGVSSRSIQNVMEKVIDIVRSVQREPESHRRGGSSNSISQKIMSILSEGSSKSKIQGFLRILGQELGFISLEGSISSLLKQKNVEKVLEEIASIVLRLQSTKKSWQWKSYYMTQLNQQAFIPTMQGIPLQMKSVLTLLNQPNFSFHESKGTYAGQAKPKVHAHANMFVGYSLAAKAGLRMNATSYVSLETEGLLETEEKAMVLLINIPESQRVVEANSSIYMFSKRPGQAEKMAGSMPSAQMSNQCHEGLKESIGVITCIQRLSANKQGFGRSGIRINLKKVQQKELIVARGYSNQSGDSRRIEVRLIAPMAESTHSIRIFGKLEEENSVNTLSLGYGTERKQQKSTRTLQVKSSYVSTSSATEYFFAVLFSDKPTINGAQDKVFQYRVHSRKESDKRDLSVSVKTMNRMKDTPKLNIEVDSEIQYADNRVEWISVRHANVDLGAGSFQTENSIKPGSKPDSMKIQSRTVYESKTLADLNLDITKTGKGIRERDSKSLMDGILTTKSNSYSLLAVFGVERSSIVATLNAKKNKNEIVNLRAELQESNQKTKSISASVAVPGRISSHFLEGTIKQGGDSSMNVDIRVKRQQELLYTIQGPAEVRFNSYRDFMEKSNLTIASIKKKQHYKLNSLVAVSARKTNVEIEALNSSKKQVLLVEAYHQRQQNGRICSLKVAKPNLASLYSKISMSEESVVTIMDVALHQMRRIKSSSKISYQSKKVVGSISVDADKDPKKKLEYDLTYDVDRSAKSAVLRGDVEWNSEKYHIDSSTKLECLTSKPRRMNIVDIKVLTPSRKELVVVGKLHQFLDVKNDLMYQNASLYVHHPSEKTYMVDLVTLVEEPSSGKTRTLKKLLVEVPSVAIGLTREFHGPVDVSCFSMDPSVTIEHDLSVKVQNKFKSTVQIVQRQGKLKTKATAKSGKYSLLLESTPERPIQAQITSEGKVILRTESDFHSNKEWVVTVNGKTSSSSRGLHSDSMLRTKGAQMLSRGLIIFNIHPGREQTEAEIGIVKRSSRRYGIIVAVITPANPKPFFGEAELVLDSRRSGLYALIDGPNAEAPLLQLEIRTKQSSSQDKVMEVSLQGPSQRLELAATSQARSGEECIGYVMQGLVSTRQSGAYDVEAAVCGPSYLQFGIKKQNQKLWNVVKLGSRTHVNFVVAVERIYRSARELSPAERKGTQDTFDVIQQRWTLKKTIAMVGMRVRHKRLINVATNYTVSEVNEFVKKDIPTALRHLSDLARGIKSSIKQTVKELLPGKVKCVPEIEALIKEIYEVCCSIVDALRNLKIQDIMDRFLDYIRRIQEAITKWWNKARGTANSIMKSICGKSIQDISNMLPSMESIRRKYNKAVVDGANRILDRISEVKFKFSVWEYIKKFLIENRQDIIRDLEKFNSKVPQVLHFLSTPLVNAIEDWLNNMTRGVLQPILLSINGDMGVSVSKDSSWIALSIPLRSPVASLSAAVTNIGMRSSQSSHQRVSERLVSGSSLDSVAVYSEKEVVALDGAQVPRVKTSCEIELCEGLGTKLSVQELEGGRRLVKLSADERQVQLRSTPGRKIEVLEPSRAKWMSKEIQLTRKNERLVRLETHAMVVHVSDVSVTVRPKLQALSNLNGLLASKEHRKSSKPSSSSSDSKQFVQHATLHSARRMFRENRVDRSCKI